MAMNTPEHHEDLLRGRQLDFLEDYPSLREAGNLISGERLEDYGDPKECFDKIAGYWTVYLKKHVTARDVANLMMLLKIARGTVKRDTLLDIIGYAALEADQL